MIENIVKIYFAYAYDNYYEPSDVAFWQITSALVPLYVNTSDSPFVTQSTVPQAFMTRRHTPGKVHRNVTDSDAAIYLLLIVSNHPGDTLVTQWMTFHSAATTNQLDSLRVHSRRLQNNYIARFFAD